MHFWVRVPGTLEITLRMGPNYFPLKFQYRGCRVHTYTPRTCLRLGIYAHLRYTSWCSQTNLNCTFRVSTPNHKKPNQNSHQSTHKIISTTNPKCASSHPQHQQLHFINFFLLNSIKNIKIYIINLRCQLPLILISMKWIYYSQVVTHTPTSSSSSICIYTYNSFIFIFISQHYKIYALWWIKKKRNEMKKGRRNLSSQDDDFRT